MSSLKNIGATISRCHQLFSRRLKFALPILIFRLNTRFIPSGSIHNELQCGTKEEASQPKEKPLVSLVLLDLLPQAGVLLDADLLGSVKLVEAAQVHVLGQQRDHVLVEGLPVRVLEVVPVAFDVRFWGVGETCRVVTFLPLLLRGGLVELTSGCPRSRSARRW